MAIHVRSRRKKRESLIKEFPDGVILDLTSKADEPWVKFSPFYPHGKIPIPLSENHFAQSVEGIWQGLKVFESTGIDPARFEITSMKNIKRTVRKYGRVLGHQAGVNSQELLTYMDARKQIYLPAYDWVLREKLSELLKELQQKSKSGDLILLDYETNCDLNNTSKPLSHAGLVKRFLEEGSIFP